MLLQLLQELLNSNSTSLNELYSQFVEKFPNEIGLRHLLQNYIYSENRLDSSELENALQKLLKRKV